MIFREGIFTAREQPLHLGIALENNYNNDPLADPPIVLGHASKAQQEREQVFLRFEPDLAVAILIAARSLS
jgi:hypothetical protein